MARRSVLFTPGDRPEMMRKAPDSGADVVVFDLEDAIAPARKDEAREAVSEVLSGEFDPDCEVCVRVGRDFHTDLDVLLDGEPRLDALMLPKAEASEDVTALADSLATRDASYPVFALIETARGVLNAEEIAAAEATTAVCFGAEDLAADVGARRTEEGTEVLYAREQTVLAASAAGVDAIDTLVTDIEATERLRDDTGFAIELGYDGKLAIHPAQVAVINDAYTPDDERIAWAERVLDAKGEADGEERGVFRVDGEMIDAPLITQAERVLDHARAGDSSR
ncbi:HpcH/HpaI aldolase/citrate lyase family protein [Halococcus sediminicola]|uniref:HpcH/HpaI aldolase/citrate lyase family protein n=1 Tax=Halococcus sediminicola TaxID=1264579 RepID=UPI0006786BB1|nr:CoA ester lyase [Halococcus sediminicola]